MQSVGDTGTPVVVVGFGATVAMWCVGYVGRLPALLLPSPLLLAVMLACLIGAGVWLGRKTGRGLAAGMAAGALSGTLNLLVLGAFLGAVEGAGVVPSAWIWVPGSLLLCALLVGVGAAAGSRWLPASRPVRVWNAVLARVAIAATMLLLAVGGLVTSAEAGLAVEDWPTSFGYNMFLFPFARMTGGIYYEHAHRLFGALVGLTTLVLAVTLQRTEQRRAIRRLGWVLLVAVVLQGTLGGLRVTELSLGLAMLHGVLAQLFFGALVALGAFTSATWSGPIEPERRSAVRADRVLSGLLVGLLLIQLVLGAAQRHFQALLIVHMVTGVGIVAPLGLHVGFRAWGLNADRPLLQRLGVASILLLAVQIVLGIGAFVATRGAEEGTIPAGLDLVFSTAHQWTGAVLLATAVLLLVWNFRLLSPADGPGTTVEETGTAC